MRFVAIACVCWFGASGCSLAAGERGADCERSAECASGLACVQHKCSTNLQAIADKSTTPSLGDDAAVDAALDGSLDGASSPSDAATPGSDSSVGGMSGSGGSSGSGGTTANPDAAFSGNDAG